VKFDIADVGREYLNVAPCLDAFDRLVLAWNSSDATGLKTAGGSLVQSVLDIDELLASQQGFLLGQWIQESRAMGRTDADKKLMELNARAQVTTWTPLVLTPKFGSAGWPAAHNINGYAEKTWAGLSRLSHAPRLTAFVSTLASQLRPGKNTTANLTGYVQEFIDLAVKFEGEEWDPQVLPATEVGLTVEIAKRLQAKYAPPSEDQ
jgi:alpha-N-acetylglucosaminidase